MSDYDVRQVKNTEEQYNAAKTNSAPDAGKVLSNGTGGANYIAPIEDCEATPIEKVSENHDTQMQQQINKIISETVSGTGLSTAEAQKMIYSLCSEKETADINVIKKLLNCLKYAIEDCTENGRLDKEKLKNRFGCYVLLTVKSKKTGMDCDKARKFMNMSLIGMIKAQNPALAKKENITAQDIADTIKPMIEGQLSKGNTKNISVEAKELLRSIFATGLAKSSSEEMKLLTEAFIILLKDNNLKDEVDIIVEEVCNNLKEQPEILNKFLNTTLVEILKKYGFDDNTIQKICTSALGEFLAKNPEAFKSLIQAGIAFLTKIKDSDDLQILLRVLEKKINGQMNSLTSDEIAILEKYQAELDGLIQVFAQIAKNPELYEKFKDLMKQFQELVSECGFGSYIYNGLQNLYENNPELFENCQSKDDFAKILNKITDNNYGETVGDTNQSNLYTGNDNTYGGIGYSTQSEQAYISALNNASNLSNQLYTEVESNYTIEKNTKSNTQKQQYVSQQSAVRSGKLFDEAWKEGKIDINYLAQNFSDACAKGVRKVWNFLDRNPQNRNEHLAAWHNADLSAASAERYDMDKDEIRALGLSTARTQFLENRYDQLHKNEADKPDMA